jgi:hypothetical protein
VDAVLGDLWLLLMVLSFTFWLVVGIHRICMAQGWK